MQCLSLCFGVCQVYFSQGTADISGFVTFIDYTQGDFIFKGLVFLFLVTKGSLGKQSAVLFLCPGICSTFMFLPWSSKDHLSNLWLSVLPWKNFFKGFCITFEQNVSIIKVVSLFLDCIIYSIALCHNCAPFKLCIRELC